MRASDFVTVGIKEAKRLPEPSSLQQKSFGDVSAALGKGKTTALLKHPWFTEYSSYDKAYKHGVDQAQFHQVEVYPYMDSVHRNAEGKIRPTLMLRFHFSDSAKISQVHKFMRDKEPGEEEKMHPGSGWRHVKSWKKSDINESKTTISQLYSGNYPDRDEAFWDYVRPGEFNTPLEIKTLPKYKLRILLQGQYRVEHLDEILDMMGDDQRETLERYMGDPRLSNKIILLSGDRIIDGNHRALAAAMKGVSINYVDLADLDEEDLSESKHGVTPTGYTWSFEHGGEVPYKSDVEVNTFIRVSDSKGKTVLGVWADVYRDDVEIQYSEVFDKKLRSKGIYTDFLKGLAKHYNIISDQDQNNAARSIYKKLGADYDSRSERHTLRRSSQSVEENNENTGGDYAIHLGNLKRFFKAEDPLEELVPERRTHYYALHSDIFKDDWSALPWRKTFASLTGKDFKEVLHNPKILGGYRPKKFPIPPGTLVGDMHLANLYYSKVFAKTPEEKQEIARQYKESLAPLELADLSKYKKPELLIPKGQSVAEDSVNPAADYMRGHCHVMALALKQLHPSWQIRAHIGWDEDSEDDDDYRIDHVYIVAPDGTAYDCRGKFSSEEELVGPDNTGGVETRFVDFKVDDIKNGIARGELKKFSKQDLLKAIEFARKTEQGMMGNTVDESKKRRRKKYRIPRSITTGWWSGYYSDGSSDGDGGGGE